MKIKNDERQRTRRLPKLAISLLTIAFVTGLMLAASLFGLIESIDTRMSPEDILLNQRYENAQSFTILNELNVSEDRGTLYLVEWHGAETMPCIGLIWIKGASRPSDIGVGRANAHCVSDRYSIDQYWGMRSWPRITFSVAFGYSGDAANVVVSWQDDSVTELQPVHGSYLAVNGAKSRVIESVEFYDEAGSLLHQFPDSEKTEAAGS